MINNTDLSGRVAYDANSLNNLKLAAKENSPEAIKAVAKQFEAVFMNMMLKSMREATPKDNPFDNEQSRTFTSMLDQQLSSNLSSKGLGLADVLTKQLSKSGYAATNSMQQAVSNDLSTSNSDQQSATTFDTSPILPNPTKSLDINQPGHNTLLNKSGHATGKALDNKTLNNNSTEFQNRMAQHAEDASRATGVPAN